MSSFAASFEKKPEAPAASTSARIRSSSIMAVIRMTLACGFVCRI